MCIPNQTNLTGANAAAQTQASYNAAGGIPLNIGASWSTTPTSIPGIGPGTIPTPTTTTFQALGPLQTPNPTTSPVIAPNYAKAFAVVGGLAQIYSAMGQANTAGDKIESLEKAQEADNIKFRNRQALNDLESRDTIDSITKQAASARAQYRVAKDVITGGSTARLLLQDMRKNELDMKERSIDLDTQKRIAMREQLQSQYAQRVAQAKEIADSVPTYAELAIGIATTAIAAYATFGVGMFATGMGQALIMRREKYKASSAVTQASQTYQLDVEAKERRIQEEKERLEREQQERLARLQGKGI